MTILIMNARWATDFLKFKEAINQYSKDYQNRKLDGDYITHIQTLIEFSKTIL